MLKSRSTNYFLEGVLNFMFYFIKMDIEFATVCGAALKEIMNVIIFFKQRELSYNNCVSILSLHFKFPSQNYSTKWKVTKILNSLIHTLIL